ncbi:MAG: hypothetical protein LBS03_05730 [Bacteroidales bacterium]|jgi:hypothetical protein|nr:hypothetical protein [Bacteroidales bacterium]
MKVEEVPQDGGYLKNTHLRDIYYALDDEGNYRQVASIGWEPKNDALNLTWDLIAEDAEAVRQDVLAGKKSPLAYHMAVRLFSVGLLASYSGISKKNIRKHLQAKAFEQIDEAVLAKYAETMHMSVDELKKLDR